MTMKFVSFVLFLVRIGHGIQALENEALGDLVRAAGVHLEICPISEYFTGSVQDFSNHPVKKLLSSGLDASLATDNHSPLNSDFNGQSKYLFR